MKNITTRMRFLPMVLACSIGFAQPGQVTQSIPGASEVFDPRSTSGLSATEEEVPTFLSKEMQVRWRFVRAYMAQKSPLGRVGAGTLSMMGDEAAFHVYGIINRRPPLTPDQTLTVLDILHSAFAKPAMIQNGADLNPSKTQQLLKILEKTAVDQRVKERIATENRFLQTVPNKIVHGPLVITGPVRDGAGDAMPHKEDFEPKK